MWVVALTAEAHARGLLLSCGTAAVRSLGPELEAKRAYLAKELADVGFGVLPSHGAYFLVADISPFLQPGERDTEFAQRLTVEGGVTTIPISGFYVGAQPPTHLVRAGEDGSLFGLRRSSSRWWEA
jgi:aspartate/methionine/tyrosine aminotransferase